VKGEAKRPFTVDKHMYACACMCFLKCFRGKSAQKCRGRQDAGVGYVGALSWGCVGWVGDEAKGKASYPGSVCSGEAISHILYFLF
jgi:hypothetical protein